jgi:hypothetical protein
MDNYLEAEIHVLEKLLTSFFIRLRCGIFYTKFCLDILIIAFVCASVLLCNLT